MRFLFPMLIVATTVVAVTGGKADDGQAAYARACAACHNNLKPKIGDKAAWAPLIANGMDAMVANTIKGKGTMPPQGGKANLTDADIRAAVEYLVSKSQ